MAGVPSKQKCNKNDQQFDELLASPLNTKKHMVDKLLLSIKEDELALKENSKNLENTPSRSSSFGTINQLQRSIEETFTPPIDSVALQAKRNEYQKEQSSKSRILAKHPALKKFSGHNDNIVLVEDYLELSGGTDELSELDRTLESIKTTTTIDGTKTITIEGDLEIHESVFDCICEPCSQSLSPDLGVLEGLGKGGQATAYLFTPSSCDLDPLVIKMVTDNYHGTQKPSWDREVQHTKQLCHCNVIKYYGEPINHNGNIYNVMEYGGESIQKRYLNKSGMSEEEIRKAMFAVASGIDHLHCERAGANYVVHRDIRCDNITVTDEGVYKIIDFGISSKTTAENSRFESNTNLGHPFWKSPEYCSYIKAQWDADGAPPDVKPPGRKSDIWSFGVATLEMMSFPERPGYFNLSRYDKQGYGKYTFINELAEGKIVLMDYIKEGWSEQIKDVLRRCLEVDEQTRVDSKKLKELCENL